jgi:hypothetical protein
MQNDLFDQIFNTFNDGIGTEEWFTSVGEIIDNASDEEVKKLRKELEDSIGNNNIWIAGFECSNDPENVRITNGTNRIISTIIEYIDSNRNF